MFPRGTCCLALPWIRSKGPGSPQRLSALQLSSHPTTRMHGALPSHLFSQQAHQATALSWNCCRQASSQGPRVRRQLCCPLVPSSSLPRYTCIILSSPRKSRDLYNVFPFWMKAQGWGRGVDLGLPPTGSTCMPFPPRTLLLNPHSKAQS